MPKPWREVALVSVLVAMWAGCSSEHSNPAGRAGQSAAGSGAGATAGVAAGGGASGAANAAGRGGTGTDTGGAPAEAGASAGGSRGGSAPDGWGCIYFAYGDGKCDCGCGVPDEDCTADDLAHCEVCDAPGSCNDGACPGRIDPNDVTECTSVPDGWTCDASTYGDGTCHCGCGVVDPDCADSKAASCETCDGTSCSPFSCAVDPDDNAHCPAPPPLWACSARLYGDGSRCDCGCGAPDPDCASLGADACDRCDDPGSCSAQACPGTIDPKSNARCVQPDPPAGWLCSPNAYADGVECDCGCGVPDLDCRNAELSTCVRCLVCGGHGACEGLLDPSDSTQCGPPPSAWTCSVDAFRDTVCDCGCGIPDVNCQGIEFSYVCGNYPVEGCSAGNRAHIDPNHNERCLIEVPSTWTCARSYYDDGICDCGCGAVDLDCPPDDVTACEQCDGDGSCSSTACPGTIAPDDTARCAP